MQFPGLEESATVSVGVAMASEAGRSLTAFLATADRALYRAKADGRNRVASAPLVLVDKSGGRNIAPVAGTIGRHRRAGRRLTVVGLLSGDAVNVSLAAMRRCTPA